MKYLLIWSVMVMTPTGPVVLPPVQDETSFTSVEACKLFAEEHHDRMADYARGVLKLAWKDHIEAVSQCRPDGQPA